MILSILAFLTLLVVLWVGLDLAHGRRTLQRLEALEPAAGDNLPLISVVVPARNESRAVKAALTSILRQDYPWLEVVAVDDRSTDDTGAILDRLGRVYPRLRVFHLESVPTGWLGKNHALHFGARHAQGELILFTDADVVMKPGTLRRAVRYFRENRLDHLALGPRVICRSAILETAIAGFTLLFGLSVRPWKARDPRSRESVGIGAFNLVRAEAYRAAGGHERIANRPDDDLRLGRLLKQAGYRQDVVLGNGFVEVEWYGSIREMAQGLTKNLFAGVNYRLSVVFLVTVLVPLVYVWPFLGMFVTSGAAWVLNAVIAVFLLTIAAGNARVHGHPVWMALFLPVSFLFLLGLLWKSTLTTLWRGGIEWRGTHYPLSELREKPTSQK
jgi:glycosyltransferase involved in cell wall biosynthesis